MVSLYVPMLKKSPPWHQFTKHTCKGLTKDLRWISNTVDGVEDKKKQSSCLIRDTEIMFCVCGFKQFVL